MGKRAARVGDHHVCPKVEPGPVPHVGGPILTGAGTVTIEGKKAARVGDQARCDGPLDTIAQGSASVTIEGKAAARVGDKTEHGGTIVEGSATVLIG